MEIDQKGDDVSFSGFNTIRADTSTDHSLAPIPPEQESPIYDKVSTNDQITDSSNELYKGIQGDVSPVHFGSFQDTAKLLTEPGTTKASLLQSQCREQLEWHQPCQISSCQLQAAIHSLNKIAATNNRILKRSVIQEASLLVDAIAQEMGKRNPLQLFQCTTELRGSIVNNLKTGRPDEVDFLFHLKDIPIYEEKGFTLVADEPSIEVSTSALWRTVAKGLESCFQIVSDGTGDIGECKPMQVILAHCHSLNNFVSASKVKSLFRLYLQAAAERVHERLMNDKDANMDTRFVYSNNTLIMFPSCAAFGVKIDMTPCLCFRHIDGTSKMLVPSGTANTWQSVNDDPQELNVPAVCQAICAFKGLRDIAEQAAEGSFLKDIFDVIEKKSVGNFVAHCDVSRQLTRVLNQSFVRPLRSDMPSYAINSTVVRCYRKEPGQSLCNLLLHSIQSFAFQNVEGKPLYRPAVLDKRAEKTLIEVMDTLRYLQLPCTDLKRKVKRMVPLYYCVPEASIAQNLSGETLSTAVGLEPINTHIRVTSPRRAKTPDSGNTDSSATKDSSLAAVASVFLLTPKRLVTLINLIPETYTKLCRRLQDFHPPGHTSELYMAVHTIEKHVFTKAFWEHSHTLFGYSVENCLEQMFNQREFKRLSYR